MNPRAKLILQSGFWFTSYLLLLSVQSTRTFAADGVRGFIQVWVPPPPPVVPININVSPSGAGMVDGPSQAPAGSTVYAYAIANPGAEFSHWSRDGEIIPDCLWNGCPPRTGVAIVATTEPVIYTAHFAPVLTTINLEPAGGVISEVNVPISTGQVYTVAAEVTNRWYVFSGWYRMHRRCDYLAWWCYPVPTWLVSTNPVFIFQSDGTGLSLGAQFTFIRQKYNLHVTCNPPFSGRLGDEQNRFEPERLEQIWEQDSRVLSAAPVPGYKFNGWKSESGTVGTVVTAETNAFFVATNCAWTAQFSPTCSVAVLRFEWDWNRGIVGDAQLSRQVQTLTVPAGTNVVLHIYEPRRGFSPGGWPMTSRWKHNGKWLAEPSDTLTLTNVGPRDGGTYRFVFQLEGKKFTSSMVRIRVVKPWQRGTPHDGRSAPVGSSGRH